MGLETVKRGSVSVGQITRVAKRRRDWVATFGRDTPMGACTTRHSTA